MSNCFFEQRVNGQLIPSCTKIVLLKTCHCSLLSWKIGVSALIDEFVPLMSDSNVHPHHLEFKQTFARCFLNITSSNDPFYPALPEGIPAAGYIQCG